MRFLPQAFRRSAHDARSNTGRSAARIARQGFDGTSLSQIAGDVGIKAPSIYAHFKNKEQLFLGLLPVAIEHEIDYMRQSLSADGDPAERLFRFLKEIETRGESSPHALFLLRMAYIPPPDLAAAAAVKPFTDEYMDAMERLICGIFRDIPRGKLATGTLAGAYLGIIDSLQAEILYGGKTRFRKRLKALWAVFALGLEVS